MNSGNQERIKCHEDNEYCNISDKFCNNIF